MDTEQAHTLTGAYAAGALEDADLAGFEEHLAACPACREEVAGLRETVAVLAQAVAVRPPGRVRAGVLEAIRTTPQERPVTPLRRPAAVPTPAPRRATRAWQAAAAVLLVAAAGSGLVAVQQYSSAQRADTRLSALTGILSDPAARRTSSAATGGGTLTLYVSGSRAAVVAASLRALPDGRVYQLWVIHPPQVTSAGLGPSGAAASGAWQAPVDGLQPGDLVAVSVEPSGGSARPTTSPVVSVRV